MGYGAHLPVFVPVPPTMMNMGYWKRYLLNIPMSLMLVAFTMMANMAIASISAICVPPDSDASKFMKDVTGIDTSSWVGAWGSIKGSFTAYTKFTTWIKLLMPPVNGGPLAFCAPLMGTSCSDLPIVPNAAVLGFSNVMVGVTPAQMARGLAVSMSQAAISTGVGAGLKASKKKREKNNKKKKTSGREKRGC
jgi:hypothetical protein